MSTHPIGESAEHPFVNQGTVPSPPAQTDSLRMSTESVTLGVGSRTSMVENEQDLRILPQRRGLLPVPSAVEAEVLDQEARHAMTADYRKTLRDRLTLEHYFSGIEVAFRRTPGGIEVLAAGLPEIAEFRRSTTWAERQGVSYGVG